jgi:hypothetical protein
MKSFADRAFVCFQPERGVHFPLTLNDGVCFFLGTVFLFPDAHVVDGYWFHNWNIPFMFSPPQPLSCTAYAILLNEKELSA